MGKPFPANPADEARQDRLDVEKRRQSFEKKRDASKAGLEFEKQKRQFVQDKVKARRDLAYSSLGRRETHQLSRALEDYKKSQGHTQYWVNRPEKPEEGGGP